VTRIVIEYYPNLRKTQVTVATYEVKQFPYWNVSSAYEAAAHHRFSHEAYVVLEWPNGVDFSLTDPTHKLDRGVHMGRPPKLTKHQKKEGEQTPRRGRADARDCAYVQCFAQHHIEA
jgi:hypothetical protein